MTAAILLLGVLAGLDNLQVCSSVGLLQLRRQRLHWLAMAFAFCEIAGPLAGLAMGHFALSVFAPVPVKVGPVLLLVCGAVVLLRAVRQGSTDAGEEEQRMLFGLPLSLSLDNVIVGAGFSAGPYPPIEAALLVGAISAAMSVIGLYCGAWLRRLVPARMELIAGAYLCLLAVRMLVADGI